MMAPGGFVSRAFESDLKACCATKKYPDLQKAVQSYIGSQEWFVLVQKQGEAMLKGNVFLPTSIEIPLKELEIPKKQYPRAIYINLLLDAGHGECVLHMDSVDSDPNVNFFLRRPSSQKLLTPISGAYFLIISGIVFGLTRAFCKFRKRKRTDEIPYQELEMGTSESAAIPVETAEGWDNSWDDDWDDDAAVKSLGAGGHQVRRVPANGLTSRCTNKDGWDNDWDKLLLKSNFIEWDAG